MISIAYDWFVVVHDLTFMGATVGSSTLYLWYWSSVTISSAATLSL